MHCLKIALIVLFLTTDVEDMKSLNVGTALFLKSDLSKDCWEKDNVVLLQFRRLMQHIIPNKLVDANDDKYIQTFLHYIDSCLDTIKENSTGTIQNLMILALADTIGGYLKSYLIPVTKAAYYAGNIRYKEISKLYTLYENMKCALDTDGKAWARPINITGTHSVHLLVLKPNKHRDMCNNIMLNKEHDVKNSCNGTQGEVFYPIISIPFLDDDDNPQSVAIPIKNSILHNLYSPESAYLVAIHYANVIKCLKMYSVSVREMYVYNLMFREWIMKRIMPLLFDENWYPAFGGILKVLDTTKRLTSGIELTSHTKVRRGFELINENEGNKFSKKEETSTRLTFCDFGNPATNDMYYIHMTTRNSRFTTDSKASNEVGTKREENEGFEVYNKTDKSKPKSILASSSGDDEDADDEDDERKTNGAKKIKPRNNHTTATTKHPVIHHSTKNNNTAAAATAAKLPTGTTKKTNITIAPTTKQPTAATTSTRKSTAVYTNTTATTNQAITATKNDTTTKRTNTTKYAATTKNITAVINILSTRLATAAKRTTSTTSVKDLHTKIMLKASPTQEGGELMALLAKSKGKKGGERKKVDERKKGSHKKKKGKAKGVLGQEEEDSGDEGEEKEEGEEEEEEEAKKAQPEEHAFSPPLKWCTLCIVLSPYFDLNYLVAHILLILMIWILLFFLNLCSRDFRVRYFLSHEEDRVKITVDYISEKLKRYPDRYYTVGLKACPDRYRRKVYSDHTEGLGPLFTRLLYTYPVQIVDMIKEKTGIGLKDVPSKTQEPIKTLSVRKSEIVEAVERDISTIIDISKPDIPFPSPISSSGSTRPGRSTSSSTATRRPKGLSSASTTGIKRKVPSTEYAPYFSSDESETEEEEEDDDDEIYAVGEHGTHFTR